MSSLMSCAFERWSPGIGDPGVMGWVIVALYLISSLMAFRVAWRADEMTRRGQKMGMFWTILGLLLLLLAINKQLDLQSLLTAVARCMAKAQGWYETRRVVQVWFIGIIALSAIFLTLVLTISLRRTLRDNGLALLGMILVLCFVAIRAAGFHHMDTLINFTIGNMKLNWLFEMTGPILILIASLRVDRRAM